MSRFYKALEDRFRGSRELILSRLRAYEELVEAIAEDGHAFRALDLGCGRGEWLQLMGEIGLAARGCDLDNEMLSEARKLGLDVFHGDAFDTLREMPDESLSVVTAFHLVEHLPHNDLVSLINEVWRTLRPGGLVILETPNPENLFVSSVSFHFDSTHVRPLPPLLLSFVLEHVGFNQVAIWRLQDDPTVSERSVGLWDVIHAASPDFAAIGRKGADGGGAFSDKIQELISAQHGFATSDLSRRFDDQLGQLNEVVAALQHAKKESDTRLRSLQEEVQSLTHLVQEQAGVIRKLDPAYKTGFAQRIKRFFRRL